MSAHCPECNFNPYAVYGSAHYYINAAAFSLRRAARYIAEGGTGGWDKHIARHDIEQAREIRLRRERQP